MADEVLSQNEIDALLSALTTGDMDAEELKKKKVKKRFVSMISSERYDFQKTKFVVSEEFMKITQGY